MPRLADYVATDMAYGRARLVRAGKVIAETPCSLLPSTWFLELQEAASIGDKVEVQLGAPLNRTEIYYMATTNHNGLVNGFCTEQQWNWKPKKNKNKRLRVALRTL